MQKARFVVVLCLVALLAITSSTAMAKEVLKVWYPGNITEPMKDQGKRFEEKTGIAVDLQGFAFEAYWQKLLPSIVAGTGPDVFRGHGGQVSEFSENDVWAPLPQHVLSELPLDQYLSSTKEMWQRDGKYYGLADETFALGLLYNKTLFKDAGFDPSQPPKTWDQVRDYALKLTKRDNTGTMTQSGYSVIIKDNDFQANEFYTMLLQKGGRVTNPDRTSALGSEKAKEVLTYFTDLVFKDKVNELGMPLSFTAFEQSKAAMVITEPGMSARWHLDFPELDYGVAPVPVLEPGMKPIYADIGRWSYVVNPRSRMIDAAWKYFLFVNSKEELVRIRTDHRELTATPSSRLDVQNDPAVHEFTKERPVVKVWDALTADAKWMGDVYNFTAFIRVVQPIIDDMWFNGVSVDDTLARLDIEVNAYLQGVN